MIGPLLASIVSIYWHLPLLILAISLVYSATRYEHWSNIRREALRWILRMTAFLLVIVVILWVVSTVT